MTNRIALILAVILIAAVAADTLLFGNEHLVFLSRKMLELIEWLAFWR
ncbi:MAG: hypothetical protein WBB25_07550 [Sulfitobacter sp.]